MIKLKTSIQVSLGLCLFSAIALFISNLALMDIGHGESDLNLEWRIMQVSYAVFILFHGAALITFIRLLKTKNEPRGDVE